MDDRRQMKGPKDQRDATMNYGISAMGTASTAPKVKIYGGTYVKCFEYGQQYALISCSAFTYRTG